MRANKVGCDAISFDNALQAEVRWLHFFWGHFGPRVDSALSYMSISGISWGVMRPELGAKNITTSDFLGFHHSRKVGTASKFVTKATRLGGSFGLQILRSQTSSVVMKN